MMRQRVDATDEQRLRDLAARMSVMAEGPGVSFIPTKGRKRAGGGKEPSTGSGEALLDELRWRSARVRGSRQLRELVEWAEREIKARTHTPTKPERTPKQIVFQDFQGHNYRAVALVVGVSHVTVWRWREAEGLAGTTGIEKPCKDS